MYKFIWLEAEILITLYITMSFNLVFDSILVRNVKHEMSSAKPKMWSVKCEVRNVKCEV